MDVIDFDACGLPAPIPRNTERMANSTSHIQVTRSYPSATKCLKKVEVTVESLRIDFETVVRTCLDEISRCLPRFWDFIEKRFLDLTRHLPWNKPR